MGAKSGQVQPGALEEQVVATITVQEGDSCLSITLPKDGADGLGIDAGDTLLITGDPGEQKLALRKFSTELLRD